MSRPKPKHSRAAREWKQSEIAALAELAKRKGINKEWLAREWLGVFPTTLSYWMSETSSYRGPTDMAKRLLTYVEAEITRLPDWE